MPDQVAYTAAAAVRFSSEYDQEHSAPITHQCSPPAAESKAGSSGRSQGKDRQAKSPPPVTPAQVVRSFNTWSFKREQPSDPRLLTQTVAAAIERRAPVPFALYWGKGPRTECGSPELQCLDFLGTLTTRVRDVYEHGAAVKLIFTDTHAELNGHSRQDIQKYFDDIKSRAEQRGFETCWLGQLVRAAGNLATAAPLEEVVPAETLARLVASAQKWYRGSATPEEGALTYLRMNLIEQRVIDRAFPGSIFVTFNGSEMRCLFPKQLPIFYMYSLRRGVSIKPWFLPSESAKSAVSADPAHPLRPDAA